MSTCGYLFSDTSHVPSVCVLERGHEGPHVYQELQTMKLPDKVNHPQHYGGDTTYEVIKVIHAWNLNFNLGNTVKYIARSGKKTENPIEDLEKARFYLNYEIDRLTGKLDYMHE
jgi:Protein of unknwon function (DUF3310)